MARHDDSWNPALIAPRLPRQGVAGILVLAVAVVVAGAPARAERVDTPRFHVQLELLEWWQAKNDVQIPNDPSATRFSLPDLVGAAPTPSARATLRWRPSPRHEIHALLAPLVFEATGTPGAPIRFAGETFASGEGIEATYRFNSWRLGYRHRWLGGERHALWIGFTAKLRDAEVRLRQGERRAKDTDLGFVPLLHVAGRRFFSSRWSGSFEVEGLAGGPGRAIDAALKLRYGPADRWGLQLGWRTIEGGADVDSVYNFAWINAVLLGVEIPIR